MNEITEYKLLASGGSGDLEKNVQKYISDGWQPFGSPSSIFNPTTSSLIFMQAMVKYK